MDALVILSSIFLAWSAILVFLYVRGRGGSLRHLKGPEPSTFWLGITPCFPYHVAIKLTWRSPGNEADIRYQNEVGDCEFKWMREYGSAWRRTGCFGVSTTQCLVRTRSSFLELKNITEGPPNVSGPKGPATHPPHDWLSLPEVSR
jgi:hypothetical protein